MTFFKQEQKSFLKNFNYYKKKKDNLDSFNYCLLIANTAGAEYFKARYISFIYIFNFIRAYIKEILSLGFIENINGFMSIHRKHIDAVGGYNDNFIGYGWEDCELYIRLQKQLNLTRITPPMCKDFLPIYHNPHQDYIRTKNQKIKNREESRLGNVSKTQYKHY